MPRSASGSRLRAFWAGGAALALLAGSAFGGAVEPPVAAVRVLVDGRPAESDLAALIPIAVGDRFAPARVDAAVKQLYKTGLFSDIRVQREGEEEIRLTFALERRLTARQVSFRGDEGVPVKKLRESLYALRPESPYTAIKRTRAEEELSEALRREGYLNCLVTSSVRRDAERPLVDVLFEIALGPRFLIRDIAARGAEVLRREDLDKLVQSRPGRPYNPVRIEADCDDLRVFLNGKGYPRATAAVASRVFHETDNTVSLVFRIDAGERVLVQVLGAEFPAESLRSLWEERIFEDWAVAQSESRILAEIRGRGYPFASVTTGIERSAAVLNVTHVVTPGERARVREVLFEGLAHMSPAALRAELALTPSFPVFGSYNAARLYDCPPQIVEIFEARGFPSTRVELEFRRGTSGWAAVFHIAEGPRRTIDGLTIRGAELFPAADLLAQIISVPGGAYHPTTLKRDIGRLETYYLNRGVRGTRIEAEVEETAPSRFSVAFRVDEGRRIRIDKIVIDGSLVTRRDLIERLLKVKPGDWAGAEAVLESRRALERLGVFSEVKIEEIPVGPEAVNLVIGLREGERNTASLGVGLETKNEPVSLDLGRNVIGPRATAEFIRSNMLGRAAQLSFVGQFSNREKRAVASWEEPYPFGLALPLTVNAWIEREERQSYGFDRTGLSLSGSRPLSRGWLSLTTLRWARTTLYFLDVEESEVDRQHYPYSATAASESLILDRRDDTFNPERGSFLSLVLDWAVPLFETESDYLKSFVKYQTFRPVLGTANLQWTVRFGLGMGRMPIHERFFGGGSNSFRGRYFDELGPQDPGSGRPVGGKALLLLNLELKTPIFHALPALAGAVFCDIGNVFAHRSDFSFQALESALGVGLRYRTPLGPIRFDLAWNLHPRDGQSGPLAFITIGNVF